MCAGHTLARPVVVATRVHTIQFLRRIMFRQKRIFMPMLGVGLLCAVAAHAQDKAGALDALSKQMAEMQASIAKMQEQHQQELTALKSQIEAQQRTIDDLQKKSGLGLAPLPLPEKTAEGKTGEPAPGTTLFPTTDPSVVAAAPTSVGAAAPAATEFPTTDASVTTEPGAAPGAASGLTAPITLTGGGKSFLNISFDAMFAGAVSTSPHLDRLEVGDHDPQQRGFNARNLEIALDGAVDPYFQGFANIVFKLENDNETEVEVEEAFMQTTSLPWGLQMKGGQFFTAFGRINPTHPHTWDFADAPLVQGRLLGPDGLRGVGVQASWVTPLPWYSQVLVAVQNGGGGTAYSFRNPGEDGTFFGRETIDRQIGSLNELVLAPRWENSFDLTPTQTVLFGVSAAFGANDTGPDSSTQVYGGDLFYKWKPVNAAGGWPFVKWQSEVMFRNFEAGRGAANSFPVSEDLHDWGAYSQVVWGFKERWTAGVRYDYLHMEDSSFTDDPDRQSRDRISADVTWYPSEFSKLRLQYNHDFLHGDHFNDAGNEDSVFLQFEFALGAHGAHKY
jgi:hypothetical protein